MKPMKLAFVGGGLNSIAGYTHFSASRMDNIFQVTTGVFSRNENINKKTADYWGVKKVYNNLEEMIEEQKDTVDAFVVLLPTPDHYKIVSTLLKRDIPVICEKPLVSDYNQLKALKEIYIPKRHFLTITYNYSGYPLVRELKAMIEEGELGDILHIHLEMPQESFLRPPKNLEYPSGWRKLDGNIPTVCLDLGTHLFHLLKFLIGKTPAKLVSKMNIFTHYGVIDDVKIITEFHDRTTGYLWFGKTALGSRNGLRVRVFGTKASAEWLQMDPEKLFIAKNDGIINVIDRENSKKASERIYNRMFAGHPAGFIEAFANRYRDIGDALQRYKNGVDYGHPYIWKLEDEETNLLFFKNVVISSQEGRWIEIMENEQ